MPPAHPVDPQALAIRRTASKKIVGSHCSPPHCSGCSNLKKPGLLQVGDIGIGKTAQLLCLGGALAQPRKQLVNGGQNGLRVTLLNGRHCMPPGSAVLILRLEHVTICVEQGELVAG